MSIRAPQETVNLAELYDQELMPWDRALQALGTGSLEPCGRRRLLARRPQVGFVAIRVGFRPHGPAKP